MKYGKQLYTLSESQKSIWYLEKAYPGTSLNTVAGTLRFRGSVDFAALEKALNIFVENNDAMRIRIIEEDGTPKQFVSDYKSRKIDFFDFSLGEGQKDLFIWDEAQTRIPFDMLNQELFYCALFKVSDEEGGFYMKMHHLISDAWTMGLVVKHVVNYYTLITGGGYVEEEPSPSFIEHLMNEAEYEQSKRFLKDRDYWNEKFEHLPEMTLLKPQKASENGIAAKRKTMLPPLKLSNKIREFCKSTHLSVFTLFTSALAIYINRVTGNDDIVLGTTILNRANAKEKDTAGMFVSVAAPLRISVNDTMNFKTFASAMLKENTDVLRHQRYPYNYLIRDLKKKHKFSNRLFDIVLSYQNSKFGKKEAEPDYTARWLFSGCQVESLIISINDREDEGNLVIDYDFLTDVFNMKEIEFIHQHIISLLWHALDNPLRSISRLEMISEREKRAILHDFNDTYADYPLDKTIHELFEEQAAKNPDGTALIFKDQTMTYRELNERANRLARVLRNNGVGPDKVVGLMSCRSFELIIGIMGVLKAGGAYMPIDPYYPQDRKLYMLDNSNADILLTGHNESESVDFDGVTLDLADERSYEADGSNLPCINSSGDLAYIIYTSGSTGKPKGVMIEHAGVVNSCVWGQRKFSLDENSIILQKTAATFDPSVWEIFWWLIIGGKVCLFESGDEKEPEAIISAIDRYKVTAMHFVPSMMSIFLNYVENTCSVNRLSSLKQVFSCGEALSVSQLEQFNKLLGEANGTELFNMYGPTEATVEVACFDCAEGVALSSVPIGRRIDNFRIFILDRNKNLLPVGIPGEIYISGAGVARGYLNNPELTSERFVENPFLPGEIMYRTGDRARWYPKGDIEFLGRMDFQVKIKGFRIELGEIEARLMSHELISEAAVKADTDENGNAFLVAYIVADGVGRDEIRAYLSSTLPDYMVPAYIMFLDEMPLNNNGKTDRIALPKPEVTVNRNVDYEAPANETEGVLAGVWGRVLGLSRVGATDDYASLGGDSLGAIRIINEIYKQFGFELSPKVIFQLQTVRRLAEYISAHATKDAAFQHVPKVPESSGYAVSSAQKRQFILNKIDGGISYNVPGGMIIDGTVESNGIEDIFRRLIQRHEALRTSFDIRDGQPVQIVHPHIDFSVDVLSAAEEDFDRLMEAFIRPFDLSRAPLFRVRLVSITKEKHYLLFDMHHIISDGTSINIIIREFVDLYNGKQLPELQVQYKDYAAWHNRLLRSDRMKKQEAYWLGKFAGEIPLLNLPVDFARPSIQSFRGNRLYFHVGEGLTAKLKKLASASGTTLFMLLMSAYSVLLSKYTGQEDIVIGTPVQGRNHSDLRGIVGMFVNTLAIRCAPAADKTFAEFLSQVKEDLLNAYENQEYPFEELVEKLDVKRDMSRNPLFDTTFVLQIMDLSKVNAGELDIFPYAYNNKTAKFDLALEAFDQGGTIDYNFEYNTDLFREETVRRLAGHFNNALDDIASYPTKKLSEINILSEEERRQLVYDFNDTYADYPRDKTIHQIFEERVKQNPDATALIFGDRSMSYGELNDKANRLARTLRKNGAGPDKAVGIMSGRSFELIIGIMAILKAGGAYLPIDPDYPPERIVCMLDNSEASILLTESALKDKVSFGGYIVFLDEESGYSSDDANLKPVNKSSDLCYLIYTSGSTGTPKGTMVPHKCVVNFCSKSSRNVYGGIIPEDISNIVSITTVSFDIFVTESLLPLVNGLSVIIADEKEQNQPKKLNALVMKHQAEVLQTTPSKMSLLISDEENIEYFTVLKVIILGGEIFPQSLYYQLKRITNARIYNIYGPTETTVMSSITEVVSDSITIGRPIANTQIYVLDRFLNPLPVGIPGEIYIGGEGVSRGYYKNPGMTKERFIPNPFSQTGNMYKTGDLAHLSADGNLVYLGRNDFQIKLRGLRIELGEIEFRLRMHETVRDAVVKGYSNDTGMSYLCAYIIADDRYDETAVREYLVRYLPEYMVPSYYIKLDEFPFTANGKVDRNALRQPDTATRGRIEYIAPITEMETNLCRIWSNVLNIERIGVMDEYSYIGGNSLDAIRIIIEIQKELSIEIEPKDIFRLQTVRALCRYMELLPNTNYESITRVETREYYTVSSAQKRQFLLRQIDKTGMSYNMPNALVLRGKADFGRIDHAFKTIIARHESLRTSFEIRDGEPVQIIHDSVDFNIVYRDEPDALVEKTLAEFIMPFDLDTAPLLRVELVRLSDEEHIMLVDMHHIISDGVSVEIFINEFTKLYSGRELPDLKIQYKDYSAWHNAMLKSEKIKKQKSYWLDRFNGEIPKLNFPLDFTRPYDRSFKGSSLEFRVDEEIVARLKVLAAGTETTLFMLLFSSFNILLSRYTGQEDIVVGTPSEGRNHEQLGRIIGMFVNVLAIRSYPRGDKTFEQYLQEVREDLLNAYENQEYPYEELVDEVTIKRGLSRNPLFDTKFSLQKSAITNLQLQDLSLSRVEFGSRTAKFDLAFDAYEEGNTIRFLIEYCTDLFRAETICRLAEHYVNVLEDVSLHSSKKLSDIKMLSEDELHQSLCDNDSRVNCLRHKIS
jgi:tyrocidine synthetase-3